MLCGLAIVLFALALLAHLIQIVKYRTWFFFPLAFGCVMEIVGYISRSLSAKKDPYHVTYFVLNYFFIVVAPVFITASIYICLNKLLEWARSAGYGEGSSKLLHPRLILWGFVACDVISTVMQVGGAAGVGKAESDRKDPTTPNNILLAGLAFQSFAFLVFLLVFGFSVFSIKSGGINLGSIRQFVISLTIASLLVFLRILFRLAETAQGVYGYLMVHEAFFGALEFAPIIVAVWILAIWHPGRCFSTQRSGKTEAAQEELA